MITAEDIPNEYDVGVVVFVRCNGVDLQDAQNRACSAVSRALGSDRRLPMHQDGERIRGLAARVVEVSEVGRAANNGELNVRPNARPYKMVGLGAPRNEERA